MVRSTKVDKAAVAATPSPVVAPVAAAPAAETKPAKAAKTPKAPKAAATQVAAPAPVAAPVVVEPVKVEETAAATEQVKDAESRLAELDAKLQEVTSIFVSMKSSVKDLRKVISREKKAAEKAAEKSSKSKAAKKVNKDRKPSGFTKPTLISDELAKFLGKDAGTEMSRTAAAKEVIAYIKSHKLTDEKNGRIIHPDAALSSLLKVTSADNVHYFNLQTFMKPHFIKTAAATTA